MLMSVTKLLLDFTTESVNIPDDKLPSFNCHSICRVIVAYIKDLVVIDGNFLGLRRLDGCQPRFDVVITRHSWLKTQDESIIDPYPVGCMTEGPLLIPGCGKYTPFGSELYMPNPNILKEISMEVVTEEVRLVCEIVRNTHRW